MKKYLTVFALLFVFTCSALASTPSDSLKVSIDWENEINKSHKYKKVFSKKDDEYISWLYLTSKKIEVLDPIAVSRTRKPNRRSGNAPLMFTIEKDGVVTYEKVRNAVHPSSKIRLPSILKSLNIKTPFLIGSLPKGTMTYTSDDEKKRDLGIIFEDKARQVKIEILTKNEELIQIIEDQKLEPGEYKYNWDGTNYPSGDYILKYTMDGQVMSQIIELESNAGSWLKNIWNRIF